MLLAPAVTAEPPIGGTALRRYSTVSRVGYSHLFVVLSVCDQASSDLPLQVVLARSMRTAPSAPALRVGHDVALCHAVAVGPLLDIDHDEGIGDTPN